MIIVTHQCNTSISTDFFCSFYIGMKNSLSIGLIALKEIQDIIIMKIFNTDTLIWNLFNNEILS